MTEVTPRITPEGGEPAGLKKVRKPSAAKSPRKKTATIAAKAEPPAAAPAVVAKTTARAKPKAAPAAKRAPARKPAAKTAAKAAPATRIKRAAKKEVSPEERMDMIRLAAYVRAERRGFVGGNPIDDWVAAEAEVDAQLSNGKGKARR